MLIYVLPQNKLQVIVTIRWAWE